MTVFLVQHNYGENVDAVFSSREKLQHFLDYGDNAHIYSTTELPLDAWDTIHARLEVGYKPFVCRLVGLRPAQWEVSDGDLFVDETTVCLSLFLESLERHQHGRTRVSLWARSEDEAEQLATEWLNKIRSEEKS